MHTNPLDEHLDYRVSPSAPPPTGGAGSGPPHHGEASYDDEGNEEREAQKRAEWEGMNAGVPEKQPPPPARVGWPRSRKDLDGFRQ